ncbi:hypothetical protein [Salinimonas sediminis]|uniref:Uncharacterized protein n=1 Tax=Salinimonas sediminis TaxID=2303538 RepID=A0A346NIM8_9ALTE|nr:hypothetical protein [Salinimonas sediminis]AXR05385.1 hypothetical protein D0Y50_02775 [Salinimonas sediminis]
MHNETINVVELEKLNDNQQVKVTIYCVDMEMKAYLKKFINENKNLVSEVEVYPMASVGNKSETEILNFILSFGMDTLDTAKDELITMYVGYLVSELKNRNQKCEVKEKDNDTDVRK